MKQTIFAILLTVIAATIFAADPPPKPWTSSIGAGLAITSGNTDTKNYNLSLATKYDPKTKFVFKADALYLRLAGIRSVREELDPTGTNPRQSKPILLLAETGGSNTTYKAAHGGDRFVGHEG